LTGKNDKGEKEKKRLKGQIEVSQQSIEGKSRRRISI